MIYIMEMFTRMILNKAQLPALKSFAYFLFEVWQIMSWHSFVYVKIIIFRFKKVKKLPPKKKIKKKRIVNVFTIKSYMMTHDDMHHEHYEKCIESQSFQKIKNE
jgi:hypothetical protein